MSSPVATAVLGLDVGGANLKAAHTGGFTRHVSYHLWKHPEGLAQALRNLVTAAPSHDVLAVTMTGELCDCFESKRQGVLAILDAVSAVAGPTPVRVWTTEGRFTDLAGAKAAPLQAASANWLALATFVGRFAPKGPALLIDVGTTTTDVIPLLDGRPAPQGRTDPERLQSGELVYRGWRRTPLCIFMADGAAEFFATAHDVYLVLKMVPEDATDHDTADGRPATRAAAHRRLARMMCADLETSTPEKRETLASILNLRLTSSIALAVNNVVRSIPGTLQTVIGSGSGEFLIPMVLHCPTAAELPNAPTASATQLLGANVSAVACAHAVAILCAEQEG